MGVFPTSSPAGSSATGSTPPGVCGDERSRRVRGAFAPGRSVVEALTRRDVRGWGLRRRGQLAAARSPASPASSRATPSAPATATPGAGTDRSFRQTGIQANEAGFGGVERFPPYGILLDPELSNLGILTLGGGLSLFARARSTSSTTTTGSSSPPTRCATPGSRRSSTAATGPRSGVDLVLAVEEWERVELDLALAAFRAGPAFGRSGRLELRRLPRRARVLGRRCWPRRSRFADHAQSNLW